MKIIIKLSLLLSVLLSLSAWAEISVIVNPDNTNDIDVKQIRAIYLAKTNVFDNGDKATPVDVSGNRAVKDKFAASVLRKSPSSLNSYWSRMIFSAKGAPPKTFTMSGVRAKVAVDITAIGYIESALVDESVKVIYTFE